MRYRITGFVAAFFLFVNPVGIIPPTGLAPTLSPGPASVAAQYSTAVEQWRSTVIAACGQQNTGCIDRIMWLIACESGGNPNAVSYKINPGTGMHDYGLLQISPIWGDIAYADGASQIYWAASRLGSVWWAC